MTATSQNLKEEIASLNQELEERKLADVEQMEILERARTDIEALHADRMAKDQEIDQLRAELSTAAASPSSPSLDKEMMNALKQQHRLEYADAARHVADDAGGDGDEKHTGKARKLDVRARGQQHEQHGRGA